MSSCVAELGTILQSMLDMKAPGVNQSKITSITTLCNANVQSETVLIQKLYTHFKKAPSTHKLGVLYVVDSVTRQWVEQVRKSAGQSSGADGTFAAGVNHVTELLPSFMTDIINTAPEEQKAKIKKLIDIWERGSTFPVAMLTSFKEKLNAPAPKGKASNGPVNFDVTQSTTPNGSPPQDFIPLNKQANNGAVPTTDTSAILANLQALADLAKKNTPTPAASGSTTQASNVTIPQNAFSQMMSSVNQAPMPAPSQAVNVPGAGNGVYPYSGGISAMPNFPQSQSNGQTNVLAPPLPMMPQGGHASVTAETLQQQLQILQALKAQGVPQDQWATVLSVLMSSGSGATGANPTPIPQPNYGNYGGGANDQSRDRNGYDQYTRSPPNRYRNNRSRSPPAWDRRREPSPPRRRDSPVYGEYGNEGRGGGRGRGNGNANVFRQRSPDRYRRSPSPRREDQTLPPPGPRYIEYDRSIGEGMIKVLSRTLFVGGVTCPEDDLRQTFSAFGKVQTCIVNVDKRHAFVKMINRTDAVAAKEGMEHYRSPEMQLRTRWGVGFGPRDCSDYQTGISIIPIDRLTDADRKWMLTAEYGGTGGKTIEGGMVVEEPDIEIGAGVSSKAISRRMQTDKGGQQGPRSTRDGGNQRFRQPDGKGSNDNPNPNHIGVGVGVGVGVPPPVPGFGFQFPQMPNGMTMPMFPPGFVMPGAGQPPPPGSL